MAETRKQEPEITQPEPYAQAEPGAQPRLGTEADPADMQTIPGARTPLATDATPAAQPDLAPYKAPLLRRAMAGAAEKMATCVDGGRTACEGISQFIRNRVNTVIQKEKAVTGIQRGVLKAISGVLLALDKGSVKLRLTERVPIHNMPQLISDGDDKDERQADILFKGDLNDFLDSRIFVDLPFIDGIEPIAKQAFDKGIPPEALIKYLESEEILELIVHEILTVADSRFRSSNLVATVWSLFKGAARRLRSFASRQRKQLITGEIEEKLMHNLEFVRSSYDPKDIDHTIAKLIQKLRNDYSDYDIDTWFKRNKRILMEILLGKEIGEEGPSNISRIVQEIFERRGKGGKERLKEFIKLNLELFFTYEEDPSRISFLKNMFIKKDRECEPTIMLDLEFLKTFFGDVIPRVQRKEDSLAELRNMIIEAVEEMIDEKYPQVRNVIIRRSTQPGYELVPLENNKSLKRSLAEFIKETTQTLTSHVDVAELLADPTESSLAIETAYGQCFTPAGEARAWRKEEAFYDHLRSMVGVVDEIVEDDFQIIRKERFDAIERRLRECLRGADAVLRELDETLGFPAEIKFDNIDGEEDYATLVQIAHTAETLQERFAARCKLELAMVYFSVRYAPRSRFQGHDARQLRLRLENSPHGVAINHEGPLHDVHFLDKRNGEVEMLESTEQKPLVADQEEADTLMDAHELRKIQLIPGKFGDTDCWFAPVARNEEEIEEERAYMDSKSDVSKALKVIRRDETRAKDITDIHRMTIVVNSRTAMDEIRKHIESDYLSFGQVIKTENRYYGFVRVKTTANVRENVASSGEYNALRYVADIPIRSGDGEEVYLAPIEIRVLFVEDYVKEKSHYHPASHEKYERERARVCARKLRPQEVWPQLYKEVCPFTEKPGPDPNDPWQRTKVGLKDPEDFEFSGAA